MYLLDPSGLTGLEPAASALTGRCSDQLNYNPRELRDLAENLILFYSCVSVWRTSGLYHLMVDWRIIGPSWIWTSVDILPTNLQSVPINRSGIDPGRIHFLLGLLVIHYQLPFAVPYPQGKSNPRRLLEREMSWTTRRWGHTCPTAIILWS